MPTLNRKEKATSIRESGRCEGYCSLHASFALHASINVSGSQLTLLIGIHICPGVFILATSIELRYLKLNTSSLEHATPCLQWGWTNHSSYYKKKNNVSGPDTKYTHTHTLISVLLLCRIHDSDSEFDFDDPPKASKKRKAMGRLVRLFFNMEVQEDPLECKDSNFDFDPPTKRRV